jgi:hypothetical protein
VSLVPKVVRDTTVPWMWERDGMTLPTDSDLNAVLRAAGILHCFGLPYPWARPPQARVVPFVEGPEGKGKRPEPRAEAGSANA